MSFRSVRPRRTVRSTVVEPFKQVKLGVYVIGLTLVFLAAGTYLVYDAFAAQYRHVMGIFSVVDPDLRWELITNDLFYAHAVRLGILLVSFVATLFGVVVRMTHKVYGPLVSIERFVDEIADGQYHRRITIRSGDDLQRLVVKLNSMADRLAARHAPDANVGSGEVAVGNAWSPATGDRTG